MQRCYPAFTRNRIVIIFLLLPLLLCKNLFAQPVSNSVNQLKQLYENVEFESAITKGNELLKLPGNALSPDELAVVHRYMAFSFFNLGDQDSARVHFLSLLSLQPDLELNPAETSPKIIDFFQQLKEEFRSISQQENDRVFTKYVIAEDLRPGAALRSAVIPGWGQLRKGQRGRAVVLGGGFWAGLIATGVAYSKSQSLKDDYVAAKDPAEISRLYDDYNGWHKTRQALTLATAVFWVINVVDAGWSNYPKPAFRAGNSAVELSFSIPLK
ncbi:MAG: DUF5683 domain-containing protein [Calditrichia bacterium]|nr:hypothetical protein [Calditrichota bacterium]MCB9067150.1 hypothetical protein [Calditrichia bacterium]